MKLNFNFESRENHFLTSGISHSRWYLSPRFTVFFHKILYYLKKGYEFGRKTIEVALEMLFNDVDN